MCQGEEGPLAGVGEVCSQGSAGLRPTPPSCPIHCSAFLTAPPVDTHDADAQALLIVLAVESLNREAHTCVQIMDSVNRVHLERAHADEIICLEQMGGNLLVASSLNHGISNVVTELLTFNAGSEFYKYDVAWDDTVVGKEFSEAVGMLATRKMILLGFETDYSDDLLKALPNDILHLQDQQGLPAEDNDTGCDTTRRVVVVNPQGAYSIRPKDALFVVAESAPQKL